MCMHSVCDVCNLLVTILDEEARGDERVSERVAKGYHYNFGTLVQVLMYLCRSMCTLF